MGIKRILVTGSNGFIGRALCKLLEQKQYQVVRAQRFKSLNCDHAKIKNIILIENLNDFSTHPEYLKDIDVVIHLAARAHMINEAPGDSAHEFHEVNVNGTIAIAKAAVTMKVKKIIFLSSIGAISDKTDTCIPLTEQSSTSPTSNYGMSKLLAEKELKKILQGTQTEFSIIRAPAVYGPYVKGNLLKLLKLIDFRTPMPFGLINNKRSLIYSGNLIDAICICIKHPRTKNQTYVIADHNSSTKDLIISIANALGKNIFILHCPYFILRFISRLFGKSNTLSKVCDSLVINASKFYTTVDWTPPFTFEQGLQTMCEWYKTNKSIRL